MYILEQKLKLEGKFIMELSRVFGLGKGQVTLICAYYGLNKEVRVGDISKKMLLKICQNTELTR